MSPSRGPAHLTRILHHFPCHVRKELTAVSLTLTWEGTVLVLPFPIYSGGRGLGALV